MKLIDKIVAFFRGEKKAQKHFLKTHNQEMKEELLKQYMRRAKK